MQDLTRVEGHQAGSESRSPRDLIELYWEEVWNNGNVELIRDICADPMVRHDIGSVTLLSQDEQVKRVSQQIAALRPYFTHEVLNADDRHVTSVWNMVSREGEPLEMCGIETFRAEDGRLTHCWNPPYAKGRWGRIGDTAVPADLPPPEYLSSIDMIDHIWLQKMFKAAEVEVPRIAMVTRIERVGNGTTSDVARLHFGYNLDAEGHPVALIAKVSNRDPAEIRDLLPFLGYEREVAAYRFFGGDTSFRIPRCYYAEARDGSSCNLILEDLGSDARPGDQIAGCSVTDAEAVVRELGILHVSYLGNRAIFDLDWPLRHAGRATEMARIFAAGALCVRRRYGDQLGEAALSIIDSVVPLVEAWSAAKAPVETLIHGELRVDNVIFEESDGNLRACLIDLQQVTLGDPAFDLAYFLSGSMEPDNRALCERRLVTAHSDALAAVHPGYDPCDAWERYCQNAIAGLLATIGTAGLGEPPAKLDQLLVTLARRNCAAIAHLDGIGAASRKIARAAA